MKARILTLYAETPLHPGTGQTTGVVDLPVQRERHTGFPKIEASGLKGSLRAVAEQKVAERRLTQQEVIAVFGPETSGDSDHAGALAPTDVRILAFPVRSLTDVFVWITCPKVVDRFHRDLALGGIVGFDPPDLAPGDAEALVAHASPFTGPLVLEELSYTVRKAPCSNGPVEKLATQIHKFLPSGLDRAKTHLIVLRDEDFTYFVQYATQVSARIALTGGKTTGEWINPATNTPEKGSLWYEEALPPETILYSLLIAADPRDGKKAGIADADGVLKKVEEMFKERPYLQVGGNETVGQGWCAVKFTGAVS